MRIKKFNEARSYPKTPSSEEMMKKWNDAPKVYCVVHKNDNFRDDVYNNVLCFNNDMMAADYIIKYVNYHHNQDFEVYYDNDGERFFSSLDENEDYELCEAYCKEHDIRISMVDGYYHTTPKIVVSIDDLH